MSTDETHEEEGEDYAGLNPDDELDESELPLWYGQCPWKWLCGQFPVRGGGVWLWAMHICGNKANQAIALLQIIYWCQVGSNGRPRSKFHASGGVAKSCSELALETGLTDKMARTAVNGLVERGFLQRDECLWRRRITSLLVPQPQAICDAIANLDSDVIEMCRGSDFG